MYIHMHIIHHHVMTTEFPVLIQHIQNVDHKVDVVSYYDIFVATCCLSFFSFLCFFLKGRWKSCVWEFHHRAHKAYEEIASRLTVLLSLAFGNLTVIHIPFLDYAKERFRLMWNALFVYEHMLTSIDSNCFPFTRIVQFSWVYFRQQDKHARPWGWYCIFR